MCTVRPCSDINYLNYFRVRGSGEFLERDGFAERILLNISGDAEGGVP